MKTLSPLSWILFFGYALILAYFNFIDVYHHEFFSSGFTIISYNVIRICFIFYLMWLFYAAGALFLKLAIRRLDPADDPANKSWERDDGFNNTLLSFFAGVGVWHIILLCIGFAGLYTRSSMAIMTLALFAASLPRLSQCINFINTNKKPIYWQGWVVFLIPMFFFLITKGLYPSGGHDYFNHYFPYYLRVTETGSILPNELWYHFYYNKGDGLFFLSMLLTDPLAPQLATTALMIAGAALVFSILKDSAGNWRLLPWFGAALYITFLIYTPGPLRQEGWADLEKSHEPASVLMLAIIWQTIGLAKTNEWLKWGIVLILSVSAMILIDPFVFPFAGIYLGLVSVIFYFYNHKSAAFWAILGALASFGWFILLDTINYFITGAPDEQKLLIYLPYLHFDKIKKWGFAFELLKFHWDRGGMIANQLHLISGHFLHVWFTYIRLDIWIPLFVLGIGLLGFTKNIPRDKTSLYVCGGFLLMVLLLSLVIGRDQHFSYYRFTIFTYAPMLCLCLLMIAAGLQHVKSPSGLFWVGYLFTWSLLMPFLNFEKEKIYNVIANGYKFVSGKYSIADGYRNQQGWPGRKPWGAIYPGAEVVWSQLPPKTRIWSMHENSYCMLPDCRMETHPSYIFSPHADDIYFGKPNDAKACLKKENLNYFFFSNRLGITDPLPLAPLFSPKHIADYLGIAWTDGTDTLLTWKEDAQYPINKSWLDQYRQSIKNSGMVQSFPYEQIQTVFKTLAQKSQLENSDIPWYH